MSIRLTGLKFLAVLGVVFGTAAARGEELNYGNMNEASYASRVDALEAELASLKSNLGSGYCGSDANSCNSGCNCSQGGVIAGVEMVLLTPHSGALQIPGVANVTPGYGVQASPRLWLGYRNDNGLGVRARYWTFDADAGPSTIGLVSNLHMEALDLEVTQTAQLASWNFDLSFGIRWAQDRNTLALGPIVAGQQNFEGTGGTIALGAWRQLGHSNLSLFANTRASLLYGQNDYPISVALPPIGPAIGIAALRSEDEVVSIYELQMGVEWSRQTETGSRWFARAALECQAWNIPSPALGLLDDTTGLVGVAFAIGYNH